MAEHNSLEQVRMNIPASPEAVARLEPGNIVFLDGRVYGARIASQIAVHDERPEILHLEQPYGRRFAACRSGDPVNERLEMLYEGLMLPALHRFAETDDRRDEIL